MFPRFYIMVVAALLYFMLIGDDLYPIVWLKRRKESKHVDIETIQKFLDEE